MIEMFRKGIFESLPKLEGAASAIAATLNPALSDKAVIGPGTSPFSDLLNGYLAASGGSETMGESGDLILQIDGETFARLIAPKLTREYRRSGIILGEA